MLMHCTHVSGGRKGRRVTLSAQFNLNHFTRSVVAIMRSNVNAGGLIVVPGRLGEQLVAPVRVEHGWVLGVVIREGVPHQEALVVELGVDRGGIGVLLNDQSRCEMEGNMLKHMAHTAHTSTHRSSDWCLS